MTSPDLPMDTPHHLKKSWAALRDPRNRLSAKQREVLEQRMLKKAAEFGIDLRKAK